MSDTHDPPKTDDHSVPTPPVPAQASTTPRPTSPQHTNGHDTLDVTVLPQSYDQQHAIDAAETDHRGEEHVEESHHDVMSDALLDDMVDFDAAFDPDTLANLAALSRIQGMVDEAVAENERQEQHGAEGEGAQADSGEMVDFSMFLPGMAEETDQSASILQGLDQGQPVEVEESRPDETGGEGGTQHPEPEVEQQPEAAAPTTTEPETPTDTPATAPVDSTIDVNQAEPTAPAAETVEQEATPSIVDAAPDSQPPQPENQPPSPPKSAPIVIPQVESTAEEAQVASSSADLPAPLAPQDDVGPHDSQDQLPIDPALLPASGPISRASSTVPDSDAFSERIGAHHKGDRDGDEGGRDDEGDDDFGDSKYVYEDGKLKRRRQRTVLSCTECHRRKRMLKYEKHHSRRDYADHLSSSDNRTLRSKHTLQSMRGVASMCRMEMPPVQERKRRKMTRDTPVNYELGVRVQALESLIRSGSTLDPDSASSAAMETILHATRAAELGSSDATSALAQLTDAMGGQGIGSMSQDAQSTLLMDVLQQLSVASLTKPPEEVQEKSRPSGKQDMWSHIALPRPDPTTRIANAYEEDVAPTKINLSLPGFREDEGKIFVPPTVRYVEKQMRNESMLAAEALPVWGDDKFLEAGIKFAYGPDEKRYRRDHVSAVQAISLTGALRLAGTFLSRIPSRGRQVYLPSPSTDEDTRTLRDAGLEIRYYRFLDRKTGNVDFDDLREDILTAPERSAILLFVTGSMPTGLDLSLPQWKSLITLLHQRNLIPLVVMAFQGLVTGDPSQDAEPLRLMAHEGLPVVLCQIFDATMGLYADSPSIVSIVTQSEESKERVDGQLRGVARGLYLHPSPWGAFVARAILSDSKLHPAWLVEIKAMSDRLRSVREKLYDLLATKFKTPGTWSHIKKSVGMYCTTLLPPAVNDSLTLKRHIHLLPHGSISLGTLNSPKIEALARAIDSVVLAYNRELEEAQAQQLAMQIALAAAREAAAREEEEAEAQAAEDEDRMLLEQDLASAIEAQTRAEEDERRREEEEKGLEEAVRRAAERAETARAAEAILASITAGHAF